jgi:hypothetical protein
MNYFTIRGVAVLRSCNSCGSCNNCTASCTSRHTSKKTLQMSADSRHYTLRHTYLPVLNVEPLNISGKVVSTLSKFVLQLVTSLTSIYDSLSLFDFLVEKNRNFEQP